MRFFTYTLNKKEVFFILSLSVSFLFIGCSSDNAHIASIKNINHEINGFKYKKDIDTYGINEKYADIDDFYKNNGGDCEDFCIAKYRKLSEIGIDNSKLSFVLLSEKNFKKNPQYHMVLRYSDENSTLWLDNNTDFYWLDRIWKIVGEFDIKDIEKQISKTSV